MMIAVSFISLCFASLVLAEDPVAYGSYDSSSTAAPLENEPSKLGELKPMFVPHGTMGDGIHMHNSTFSEPMEVESDMEHTTVMSENGSVSDFLGSSSMEMGDTNSTEGGPSTKPTHIMVIPRKNITAIDGENSTDSSMDKEASAATSEKDTHSKGAGSSASVFVVLALFTISTRLILSH